MTDNQPKQDPPKIIIDEDWKSRVETEKQTSNTSTASSDSESIAAAQGDADMQMPPASFDLLVSGLATEAMMALGQLPNPMSGERTVLLNQAKYLVDMIEVLRDKTKGNVSPEEEEALTAILHQLRMTFVSVRNSQQGGQSSGIEV